MMTEEYKYNMNDQDVNQCLKKLTKAQEFLVQAISGDRANFLDRVVSYRVDDNHSKDEAQAITLLKYILIDYHANCEKPTYYTRTNERTPYCEHVIPIFKYFSAVYKSMTFMWCEKSLEANKQLAICLDDEQKKLMDGIVYSVRDKAERLVMECSGEVDGEHTEEDTLKLMEATSRCLKNEMGRYQSSSWLTFGARKVLVIQAINNTITLLSTKRVEGNKWAFIEQRSALIPRDWEDRMYWIKVVELLMKLNELLSEQEEVTQNHEHNVSSIERQFSLDSPLWILGAHLDTHPGQHDASVDSEIKNADGLRNVDDDNGLEPEDQPTIQEPLPTISPSLHPGNIAINPINVNPLRKTFDEAVIDACQQSGSQHAERQKTLYIVDALDLKPFAIFDKNGIEQNALAHERVISSITAGNDSILPILPLKRSYDDEESAPYMKCTPITAPGLDRILASSPYSKLIRRRQYVELSSAICKLLNQDWEFHPQMRYFTAKVFSGAIMHNTGNGQAIIVNTVESYGRTKHVDGHREAFGRLKDTVVDTSLPPPIDTKYPDVWPNSLQHADGTKLLIGTQVSNVLITSSMRLDARVKPYVGSSNMSFRLSSTVDSLCARLYLDSVCLEEALAILESPDTSCLSSFNMIYQLCQIRSKFATPSAYALCRSSGPITLAHVCQPYTVFTLADNNRGNNPGATLFRTIGVLMLKHGNAARLQKRTVEELASLATGKIKELLLTICRLFPSTDEDMAIINNEQLSKHLSTMADLLMPSIAIANNAVALQVSRAFDFAV
ncbi:hypothetical protein G6F57_011483 [Rhizopus arrhizus]|nr:hypothetical protein G6F30_011471 [Rhizopus arrhizus]KAG1408684.1 hypothetical protein G6F58_009455 [Rhizopus delemar]KAG0975462.1 hypothetical protein G6F29_011519 [Rhizopus arrhizus]KAG0981544.1 hypothetical protein G6F28_011402 [Rhizopus arrhizus]KAG1003423.1 hypothetical protein G6F27_011064 [Rhizopus arrhizus]